MSESEQPQYIRVKILLPEVVNAKDDVVWNEEGKGFMEAGCQDVVAGIKLDIEFVTRDLELSKVGV